MRRRSCGLRASLLLLLALGWSSPGPGGVHVQAHDSSNRRTPGEDDGIGTQQDVKLQRGGRRNKRLVAVHERELRDDNHRDAVPRVLKPWTMGMDTLVTDIVHGPLRLSPPDAATTSNASRSTVDATVKAAADAISDPMQFLDGKFVLVVGDSHALGLFNGLRSYLQKHAKAKVVKGSSAMEVGPRWSGADGDIVKSWRQMQLKDRRNHTLRLRMHECEGPFGMLDALQPHVPRAILPLDGHGGHGGGGAPDVVVFGYGTHYHRNWSMLMDHSVRLTAHIETRLGHKINRETPAVPTSGPNQQQPLHGHHQRRRPFFIFREMHATFFPTPDGTFEQRGDYDCVRLTQSQLQTQRDHPTSEPISHYFRQAGYAILDTFDLNANRPQDMVGSGDCSHIKPKSDLHRRYSMRLLALLSAEASFRKEQLD